MEEVMINRNISFFSRFKNMLKVDFKRIFSQPNTYIFLGISLVLPVLILLMTSFVSEEATITSVWQSLGSLDGSSMMSMDILSMCNINLIYFLFGVLACIFISTDFRSGFSKNIFTIRSKKLDYVISKIIVLSLIGMLMILLYFLGSLIGGGIASLSFDLGSLSAGNIVACVISKVFLVPIFTTIFTLISVICRQTTWLSVLLSLGIGMFLFMIIPMVSPLSSNALNVILSLAGSLVFSAALSPLGAFILNKTSLVG